MGRPAPLVSSGSDPSCPCTGALAGVLSSLSGAEEGRPVGEKSVLGMPLGSGELQSPRGEGAVGKQNEQVGDFAPTG